MLAWHNDQTIRDDAVGRMRAHRDLDDLEPGAYIRRRRDGRGPRGCFLGCLAIERLAIEWRMTVDAAARAAYDERSAWWHSQTERLFGIPVEVAALLDHQFETVPHPEVFALMATEAIPVGANLRAVPYRLLVDVLADPDYGAAAGGDPDGLIGRAASLLRFWLDTGREPLHGWATLSRDAGEVRGVPGLGARAAALTAMEVADHFGTHRGLLGDERSWPSGPYGLILDHLVWASVCLGYTDSRAWLAARLIEHLTTAPVPPGRADLVRLGGVYAHVGVA